MTRRRLGAVVAVLVLAVALPAAALFAGTRPRSEQATVTAVAATLRCPSCEAESVAASDAPIARSMEAEVRRQVAEGRTADQVRAWFRSRYGDQILLVPDSHGPGRLLWAVPLLAAGTGLVCVALVVRRRTSTASSSAAEEPPSAEGPAVALRPRQVLVAALCLVAVGAAVPVAVNLRSAAGAKAVPAAGAAPSQPAPTTVTDWLSLGRSLDAQQDYAGAVRAYRRALRVAPASSSVRTKLAFDLVRSGHPEQAAPVVRETARRPGPDRAVALLVLGLSQRARSDPAAVRTFRTFLAVAPHHPAAGQVRRLLRELT